MKTLRLDPELEERLQQAANVRGESLSEFIRRAAAERADATLVTDNEDFADVIGAIRGGGGRAHRTGEAFTESVAERAARR